MYGRYGRPTGRRMLLGTSLFAVAALGATWLNAADHDEAPAIQADQGADIADVYAFQSPENPDNVVLALTLSDVLPPGQIQLGRSIFDPEVLYELKIDNTGDAVEDLVIQATVVGNPRNQVLQVRGPLKPTVVGAESRLVNAPVAASVRVSVGPNPIISRNGDITLFAGVRDDPFFFDFGQFSAIVAGQAASFNFPGTDSFAGLNTYSLVIELPKSAIPNLSGATIWGTTSR